MKKLFILLLFPFLGCEEDNIMCTDVFMSYSMYVKDTLECVKVEDIDNGNTLYTDSNVYPEFKVVDDSYLDVMGKSQQVTLNIKFRYVNDTVHQRVYPLYLNTDSCHVYISPIHDTLK